MSTERSTNETSVSASIPVTFLGHPLRNGPRGELFVPTGNELNTQIATIPQAY